MSQKTILIILLLLIVGAAVSFGYKSFNLKEERTTGQKLGDAVDSLSDGVTKAGRELEDRTPGEKLGDAVKDVGDTIKDKSQPE